METDRTGKSDAAEASIQAVDTERGGKEEGVESLSVPEYLFYQVNSSR